MLSCGGVSIVGWVWRRISKKQKAKMDRAQMVLVGLPLFLFFTDLIHLFSPPPPPPPPPPPHHHHHHHRHPHKQPPQTLDFPSQKEIDIGGIGFGNTVKIDFCSSCSYKGNAITMNKMLETAFPGVEVVLANYPPSFPKRLLSKLVPVVQIGVMGTVIAGEQIFPMLGFVAPPPWYYSLRANKFGTIATSWLLGNVVQNFLQSTGAFEVYLNDELVFSKLKEGRFPSEIELKSIVGKRLANSRIIDGVNIGEL